MGRPSKDFKRGSEDRTEAQRTDPAWRLRDHQYRSAHALADRGHGSDSAGKGYHVAEPRRHPGEAHLSCSAVHLRGEAAAGPPGALLSAGGRVSEGRAEREAFY